MEDAQTQQPMAADVNAWAAAVHAKMQQQHEALAVLTEADFMCIMEELQHHCTAAIFSDVQKIYNEMLVRARSYGICAGHQLTRPYARRRMERARV